MPEDYLHKHFISQVKGALDYWSGAGKTETEVSHAVMLRVDTDVHPVDNASSPVEHGDDEYIIQII